MFGTPGPSRGKGIGGKGGQKQGHQKKVSLNKKQKYEKKGKKEGGGDVWGGGGGKKKLQAGVSPATGRVIKGGEPQCFLN